MTRHENCAIYLLTSGLTLPTVNKIKCRFVRLMLLGIRKHTRTRPHMHILSLTHTHTHAARVQKFVFESERAADADTDVHSKSNIIDNMLAMMEKHAQNLEVVVAERTEQLSMEKRMTENLLLRMLPRYRQQS